jgi:TolB-like protein
MSGDPEQEYFADGMVEEIITSLSRIRWLFVIARNSRAYRVIIDRLIASHRGRIFNTAGDSLVADFASAVDAGVAALGEVSPLIRYALIG